MARRQTEDPGSTPPVQHSLSAEVASAEQYALMQRVAIYPAWLRRRVVKYLLEGIPDTVVAADLRIPLNDVHAIMEAFEEVAKEQAI